MSLYALEGSKMSASRATSRHGIRAPGQPPQQAEAVSLPGSRWTFLTNHAHVLIALHANPDEVLREVARKIGITERAVQRIVQDLEDEGFLCRERVGRRNRYQISHGLCLRHPIESHCSIAGLLDLVVGPAFIRKQPSRAAGGNA